MGNEPSADHDLLIRIETKVDNFLSAQGDHEVRLRTLESAREKLDGKIDGSARTLVVLSTIFGLLIAGVGAVAAWAAIK